MYDLFNQTNSFRVTLECDETQLMKLIRSGLIDEAKIEATEKMAQTSSDQHLPKARRWEVYRAITDFFDDAEFTPDDVSSYLNGKYVNSSAANVSSFLNSINKMKLITIVSKRGKKNVYRLKDKVGHRRFNDIQKETRSNANGR
jgi:hypothetical protein